jgi:hypothetical protein
VETIDVSETMLKLCFRLQPFEPGAVSLLIEFHISVKTQGAVAIGSSAEAVRSFLSVFSR